MGDTLSAKVVDAAQKTHPGFKADDLREHELNKFWDEVTDVWEIKADYGEACCAEISRDAHKTYTWDKDSKTCKAPSSTCMKSQSDKPIAYKVNDVPYCT